MWVKNYMCKWVNTITPEKTLADAAKQMVEKKTNSMVVVDEDNKPIGMVSAHLLIKQVVPGYLKEDPIYSQFGAEGTFDRYADKVKNKKVEEFMDKDFHTLSEDDAMIEAAAYSLKGRRRMLLVVNDQGTLVGALTRTCIKIALYNAIFNDKKIDPKTGSRDKETDCEIPEKQ